MKINLPFVSKKPVSLTLSRGAHVESEHLLDVSLFNSIGDPILVFGNTESVIFPRSAIKPLQCLALALLSPRLSEKEFAVLCSSHNGQPEHVEIVSKILEKNNIKKKSLVCGGHWSLEKNSLISQVRNNKNHEAIFNNCSGKHAGMLLLSKLLKENPDGYEKINHPVQKKIKSIIDEIIGFDVMDYPFGIDGCGVPAFSAPIKNWAIAYARFADSKNLKRELGFACNKIIHSIASDPFMIAGDNRICTEISKQFGSEITAKTGAEGVYACSFNKMGLGLIIKCRDGAKRATEFVLGEILILLGYKPNKKLTKFFSKDVLNWKGDIVGSKKIIIN